MKQYPSIAQRFSITLILSTFFFTGPLALGKTSKQTVKKLRGEKIVTAAPAAPVEEVSESTKTLKFSTETESSSTGVREAIKFKVPGVDDSAMDKNVQSFDGVTEKAEVFKTYVGYPKHQVYFGVAPVSISSKWNYTKDFNYEGTSLGTEIGYRFVASPLLTFDASWFRYGADVAAASGPSVAPYVIVDSKTTLDNFRTNTSYCFVQGSSFYHRICPGLTIGKESYPVLEFVSNTSLKMSHVEDIVFGLSLGYQLPLTESILMQSLLGYNIGTGVGNSGALSSEKNSNLYFRLGGNYSFTDNSAIGLNFEYASRNAELVGKYSGVTRKWDSEITTLAGKLNYIYTF